MHSLLITSQCPILILQGLLYILCIVLDAILRLVGALLVTIGFGSLQELLGRYFFPADGRIEGIERKVKNECGGEDDSNFEIGRARTGGASLPFISITASVSEAI